MNLFNGDIKITAEAITSYKVILRDRVFLLCLLLPVIFWLLLWVTYPPVESDWLWMGTQPLAFVLLVLVYPLLEELSFRGVIQGGLIKLWGSQGLGLFSFANIATSILFVLFHFYSHSVIWAMAIIIPSVIFGYFRDKYQSVIPSVLLHVFYNSGYFLLYAPVSLA